MKRFKVGDTFNAAGLYGGRVVYTVTGRTANSITVHEDTADANNDEAVYLPVEVDNGTERAELWEYMGHHGYVYANDASNV